MQGNVALVSDFFPIHVTQYLMKSFFPQDQNQVRIRMKKETQDLAVEEMLETVHNNASLREQRIQVPSICEHVPSRSHFIHCISSPKDYETIVMCFLCNYF